MVLWWWPGSCFSLDLPNIERYYIIITGIMVADFFCCSTTNLCTGSMVPLFSVIDFSVAGDIVGSVSMWRTQSRIFHHTTRGKWEFNHLSVIFLLLLIVSVVVF